MKNKKILIIMLNLVFVFNLMGCTLIDTINFKIGRKNEDFEYIKDNNVNEKIVIQSTRDKGFKFLVNDPDVILDIYDILSKAKKVPVKTTLDPDYIFEIHLGNNKKTFYYVTGFNSSDEGNFYDGENIYKISKRLDNDIIQNLSFIRKPREFKTIYYNSILEALNQNKDLVNKDNVKVGIDILGDKDCAKYLLSIEIEDFKRKLKDIVPNADIVNHDREKFDIIVSVKNYGYKTKVFKTIITIENRIDHSEEKFYVNGVYDKEWDIDVSDKMPETWK